jgi:pimeloyl-ACP methyl ester carboxylesterase
MHRSVLRGALVAAVALALPLSGCSTGGGSAAGSAPTQATATPPATTSTSTSDGSRIQVGGREIYLECHGTGSPTVVLQSGFGNAGDIWSVAESSPPPVAAGLAPSNRVCVYDRPGTVRVLTDSGAMSPTPLAGRSAEAPMPRTGADAVAELHGLLEKAQVPGPFVLVGHSLGGLLNFLYARTYPEQVRGLVMVDTTPPALVSLLPAADAATLRGQLLKPPTSIPGYVPEAYDLDVLLSQIDAAPALPTSPAIPAVLLTADKAQTVSDPASAAMVAATEKVLPEARIKFQAAIPGSRLQPVPGTTHYIQVERPDVVIQAARSVM